MKVSIVYWSGTGNTEAMANAVAEGAKNAGAEVELLPVSAASADILSSDALLFGCPAMGSEELEESELEPFFSSVEGSLSGKKSGTVRLLRLGRRRMDAHLAAESGSRGRRDDRGRTHLQQRAGRRRSCRLPRARRKSGKVREYAQNYIGSRGDALRNVRNARQRCSAPRGGREKGRVLPREGQNGSHRRGRRGYHAH